MKAVNREIVLAFTLCVNGIYMYMLLFYCMGVENIHIHPVEGHSGNSEMVGSLKRQKVTGKHAIFGGVDV